MTSLYGLLPAEVEALVAASAQPAYRAGQLLHGLYREYAVSVDEIVTLPLPFRGELAASGHVVTAAREVRQVRSHDGDTTKLLLQMADDTLIETVLMQYRDRPGLHPRSTVCVSTQAGCAMGCVFCATGQMGFARNLSAGEIVAQVMHFARLLKGRGEHVTNVVFMGMGEPLANYAATVKAVRILTDPRAFGLGQRHITISTVGIIRGIERLAEEGLQVGLAISLHSPDNALRQTLVPTAGAHSVDDLLAAARRYFERTGRRVTFEYALIAGQNDSAADAQALARRLAPSGAHVNLIPVNPTSGHFARPKRAAIDAFASRLRSSGINCTVRAEKGTEISAACGQLRTDDDARKPGGPVPGQPPGTPFPVPSRSQ